MLASFSLLQKCWHTLNGDRLWRTLLCLAECVQSSLMKLTVYPSGKFYYYMIMNKTIYEDS